jgi:hypothetical protein
MNPVMTIGMTAATSTITERGMNGTTIRSCVGGGFMTNSLISSNQYDFTPSYIGTQLRKTHVFPVLETSRARMHSRKPGHLVVTRLLVVHSLLCVRRR